MACRRLFELSAPNPGPDVLNGNADAYRLHGRCQFGIPFGSTQLTGKRLQWRTRITGNADVFRMVSGGHPPR
jgi:hypothetical protein